MHPHAAALLPAVGEETSTQFCTTKLLAPLLGTDAPLASTYKLVALSTRSAESPTSSAAIFSSELGHVVRVYHGPDGARALGSDSNVELVVVLGNVEERAENVKIAIDAGKDVVVEWPLGVDFEEAGCR